VTFLNPIAFRFLGLDIRWYGILIASGMLLAILIARYTCRIRDIDYDSFLNAAFIALPAGIIGARLYYVLFELPNYISNPIEIFNIRQGGLAIHGGVIFGVLAAFIYTRRKRMNFLRVADAAAPGIILAQAIGRWGNFFNQEAHGGPVSYEYISHFPKFIQQGMYIDGVYYHPTFLYESIWDVCVFIILLIVLKRSRKSGIVFFSYIGLYSIGRFLIEGLRTDSLMLGPLRVAQLVSLGGIIVWIGMLIYYRMRRE
jgi:phosphatidylglycerol:prolipoprotein diacylglycerol transferase